MLPAWQIKRVAGQQFTVTAEDIAEDFSGYNPGFMVYFKLHFNRLKSTSMD